MGLSEFCWACLIGCFMITLFAAGLAASAFLTVQNVHDVNMNTKWQSVWETHGAFVVTVAVSSSMLVLWVLILVFIDACWPDGRIYRRRMKGGPGGGGGDGQTQMSGEYVVGGQEMGMPRDGYNSQMMDTIHDQLMV